MELVLTRSYYKDLDPNMLHLNDSSCQAYHVNETHIVMRAPLEDCGTWFVQYPHIIRFYNFARTIVVSKSYITRHPEYEFRFQCPYHKTALLSLNAFSPKGKVVIEELPPRKYQS